MPDPRSRLQVVEEFPEASPQPAPVDPMVSVGATALMIGIKALSQRAFAAVNTYFFLLSVASVWWLWFSIPNPSPTQITALTIYAAFILAANLIVRRW